MTCLEANYHSWCCATSLRWVNLILCCSTQATLETRVCRSRAYLNSHPTPLLDFYLLLSKSLFPRSLSQNHQLTFSPPHVDPIAPTYQKAYKCLHTRSVTLFSLCHSVWINGAPSPVLCAHPVSSISFIVSPQPVRSCFATFAISSLSVHLTFSRVSSSFVWHTVVALVPLTSHGPSISCLVPASNLFRDQVLIPLF